MSLYIRELKVLRKSLILWILALIFFIGAGMSKYISLSKQGDTIQELMNSMPPLFRKAMSINMLNFTKVLDFYSYMFAFIMLFGAIYAMMLGATIIIKEESSRTIEFLATKPISRNKIVTSKILAGFTNILIFDILVIAFSYLIIELVKVEPYNKEAFLKFIIVFLFFELIYFAIGTLISIKLKDIKKSTSLSLGIVFFTYILSIISNLTNKFKWIKYVSPFKYFEPLMIVHKGYPNPFFFGLSIGIIIICLIATYRFYLNKDFSI